MSDEDPVSADAGPEDAGESVVAPDGVEAAIRPSVDEEGGGHGPLGVIGLSGGSGETFDVLTDVDGSIVVRLTGELDRSTVREVEAAVERALSERGGRVVVDASCLEFVDSSAIALWVRWANEAGQIEIRDASPMLRGLILRMGLAERLRLTP